MLWNGVIDHYRDYLPITEKTPVITLQEGHTPLIYSECLSMMVGKGAKVWLKYEGAHPTGSFKDRGMTMAVSKALEEGCKAVACASTGNTSASAAAYAARAGLKCIVLIPKGAIAMGKLAQAVMHGAQVLAVNGNFDDALRLVRELTEQHPITLVNSINPYRIEGQKTGAFEICDQLDGVAPDFHIIPVGNAGNITAYWKGYNEYREKGKIDHLPVMCGFQAEGAAPIVRGYPIEKPETLATAIRIGNPASWKRAEQARDESGGLIDMVSDDEILEGYSAMAKEGLFCEPASGASIAGLYKLIKRGYFDTALKEKSEINIVCILTGHGLKDPDNAINLCPTPTAIDATLDAVLEQTGLS